MKQLLIIRHAKSSWAEPLQKDFDRPLNDRGHKDAPKMAKRLFDKNIAIDAFISSTAKRALTTAIYFAKEYGLAEKNIHKLPELYHAGTNVFTEVVQETEDHLNTIAIFSHNPGITCFANLLSSAKIDNMPTCGIFAVKAPVTKWADFFTTEKEFWFFDYPKLPG